MLEAPKISWKYRAIAIVIALVLGLSGLKVYVFGAKFAGAVTNYARLSAQQAAEDEAKAKRAAAAEQQRFKEPGVVGVQIIAEPQKNPPKNPPKP